MKLNSLRLEIELAEVSPADGEANFAARALLLAIDALALIGRASVLQIVLSCRRGLGCPYEHCLR